MRKIREKLRSESGASILLALLFFLLCAMVGASVLMAAASNAGKSRSSREEQQKYLTLSSAMQLVCDELTAAKYTAQFDQTSKIPVYKKDEDGKDTTTVDYFKITYSQKEGSYPVALSKNVLPLVNALDSLFAQQRLPQTIKNGDEYIYQTGSSVSVTTDRTFELTLTVDASDKPGLVEPVKVEVTLNENYRLSLKAWLESDSAYTMYGTLLTTGTPELTGATSSTEIGWNLSQITREEAIA